MTGRVFLRLGLVAAFAAALIAAAIEVGRNDREASTNARHVARESAARDPHRQALKRCQELGEAAIHDATCLKAWAESRRGFLTPGSGYQPGSPRMFQN